jgi:hypothetical protein
MKAVTFPASGVCTKAGQNMVSDGTTVLNFNAAVYELNAIKNAAYKFREHLWVFVE